MMVAWTKVVAVEVARRAYQLGLFQRYSQRLYFEGTFEGFSNGLDVGYEKQVSMISIKFLAYARVTIN